MTTTATGSFGYDVVRADTGAPLARLPLRDVNYTRLLTGVGQLNAALPLADPKCTRELLSPGQTGGRELVVSRNGVVDWSGPITRIQASAAQARVSITAREVPWYLFRRTIETDKTYPATSDVLDVVRDMIAQAIAKTGGGIHGFAAGTATSAITAGYVILSAQRKYVLDMMTELASSPTAGFDWRMAHSGTPGALTRTLELGAPSLGAASPITDRIVAPHTGMVEITQDEDMETGGNRVHVVTSLGGVATRGNATSIDTDHVPLVERVVDRPDITDLVLLGKVADEELRVSIPPVTSYETTFTPTSALPFGFCDLGDRVRFQAPEGYLDVDSTRRVVGIEVVPPQDAPEQIKLTFNSPLDELGT